MNSPSNPNSWIGRTLGDNNRYRLDKLLGGGGMGDVFLAMDTRIGKQVALKLLKDTLVASKEIRRRFEREIEICAALDSEHIVQVTDCGVTVEGYPFYVMEYLRGQSLRQLLLRERLSVQRTIGIITQVCKGLQHAHKGVNLERGATRSERIQVVHRDLKPDNIFLENTDSGELVKIVDFGIAKIRSESFEQTNLTSAFLGTFRYASPEQLRGAINIDGRADIYSLGIILYEMLSGADPFGFSIKARHHSEASWLFAHTSEPPKPLRAQPGCENLPAQLEEVVMRCLAKEPDKRFASVEELNLALQTVLVASQNVSSEIIHEETIAQSQPHLKGSYDETIERPIKPEEKYQEETIAQIPYLEEPRSKNQVEDTIAQIPTVANQLQLEETNIQIPNSERASAVNQPEETIYQFPNSQSQKLNQPEDTIFQKPQEIKQNINNYPEAVPEETIIKPSKKSLIPVIGITLLGFIGICSFFAYQFLFSSTLNDLKSLQIKQNYQECIDKSSLVPQNSKDYQAAQNILNECRFAFAKKLHSEGNEEKASEMILQISPDSSVFAEAKQYWEKNLRGF